MFKVIRKLKVRNHDIIWHRKNADIHIHGANTNRRLELRLDAIPTNKVEYQRQFVRHTRCLYLIRDEEHNEDRLAVYYGASQFFLIDNEDEVKRALKKCISYINDNDHLVLYGVRVDDIINEDFAIITGASLDTDYTIDELVDIMGDKYTIDDTRIRQRASLLVFTRDGHAEYRPRNNRRVYRIPLGLKKPRCETKDEIMNVAIDNFLSVIDAHSLCRVTALAKLNELAVR